MQFGKNGPNIPERLIQAHEDGHVVLFCGAGISYPACLPNFEGLVNKIYSELSIPRDSKEQIAIDAKQYDTAIHLLENRIVGGSARVRGKLAKILTPDLGSLNATATATHEALLTLGQNSEGHTRLVTTNFDRLFEVVISEKNLDVRRFRAPQLPVGARQWNGLVYLHGLLPSDPNDENLDHLIVSSSDFGRAYLLNEGVAARFVGELFRNYTVCFVGYSIGDPVLRYMTDAVGTARQFGEAYPEIFAFVGYSKGEKDDRASEWEAKNVTPILYRKDRFHKYLHQTLIVWADIHRDGIRGKERIIEEYAGRSPLDSTEQDDFTGRVLWALSDPSGLPARRFADLDPVPSLDWLKPLSEERYGQADLGHFGVTSRSDDDNQLTFSLIHRPSPHTRAPWMTIVDHSEGASAWDDVIYHLARWLTRHLDDPVLVLWLAKNGGRIHPKFVELAARQMEIFDRLEANGETDELKRIRANAPRAVPRPLMCALWRLFFTGRVKSSPPPFDFYRWIHRFKRDGLTATLRLQLREILTPRISLTEPLRLSEDQENSSRSEQFDDLVHWEVVLSSDYVHSRLRDLHENPLWTKALPSLLDDFSILLRDAMDLMGELGKADDRYDPSIVWQPSISVHSQNATFRDWTALIDLTRDAWLETVKVSLEQARITAEAWIFAPYPVFRRLAYFAAAQKGVLPPRRGLDWLLGDDRRWLWLAATQREAIRLLVTIAPVLDAELSVELEQAVLDGPPRAMYKPDIEPDHWTRIVERGVWLRLAKLDKAGATLTADAKAKLNELTSQHPDWRLESDEREEFPVWGSDSNDGRTLVLTPRRRRELVNWLKQHPERDVFQGDDWSRRCLDDFPTTACALFALARDGEWPLDRWREALYVWSHEKLTMRSWQYVRPMLVRASDDVLLSLAPGVGSWLERVAKGLNGYEPHYLEFCKRVLALDHDVDGDEEDPVGQAINHPVGKITEALLNLWTATSLEDGQGLASEIRPIFTELCDVRIGKFRPGRTMLTMRVPALFRVDREWTIRHLLPLFDWQRCQTEARAAWEGFFCSPRLHPPLIAVIREYFLDTACHYEKLRRQGEHYPALLTFAALNLRDVFTRQQLHEAVEALPERGLVRASDALVDALKCAGGQRVEHWNNLIVPYLREIWPQSIDRKTQEISKSLGSVCIAAQESFPEAVIELRNWLQPLEYPGLVMHRLKESSLCTMFPDSALEFLHLVVGENMVGSEDLKICLGQIQTAKRQLERDSRFQRLGEFLHLRGLEL